MRSCHPRWIGHRRRWTIVVSLWGKRWISISWDRHAAITRHRRHWSPRWWGQTRRWHWLSRIRWSTSTLGCYSSPPRCHLLISLSFCPLKFLLCFRMLVFHPFGFDRNCLRWALCRPLCPHHSFQALHSLGDLVSQGCKVNWVSLKDLGQVSIHRGNQAATLLLTFPDSPSFPPVLNSSAVHCKLVQDFSILLMPFLMCWKYIFWLSSFSSI